MTTKNKHLELALHHLNTNFDRYTNDLFDCLKIPSISTLSDSKSSIYDCAQYLAGHLSDIGLKNIKVFKDYGYPILYADYLVDPSRPTLLFYGHYDVQPVDPVDLWRSPPFQPSIENGYIVARGASDNKGMFYSQLKAVQSCLETSKTLPVNVKFIIEGEEEIGSRGLTKFIYDHQELLTYDALMVSDSPMFSDDQPSICTSLRGLVYFDCHVKSMNYDVHSGQLGGSVPNVIHYVSQCIDSMKNPKTNRVLIPGFYDDVISYDSFDSNSNVATTHLNTLDDFYNLGTHNNSSFYENIWYLPTLDFNGIQSGFVEDGAKTVVPCEASFKFSCRLVANQDPAKISSLIIDYISQYFPKSFEVSIKNLGPYAHPLLVNPNDPFIKNAIQALSDTHGKEIIVQGEGGSIPILAELQSLFKKPTVLIGLNAPNDNIHAPNERFKLDHFRNGIQTYIRYLHLI